MIITKMLANIQLRSNILKNPQPALMFLWVGTDFGPVPVPGKAGTKVQPYTKSLGHALLNDPTRLEISPEI